MDQKEKIEITVTEKAAKKFLEILQEQNKEGQAIRLEEVRGGCSGFKHKLGFSEEPLEDDVVLESNGLKVHIKQSQIPNLKGSVIDYKEGLEDAGFRVKNPNIRSSCGCGSSHKYK